MWVTKVIKGNKIGALDASLETGDIPALSQKFKTNLKAGVPY